MLHLHVASQQIKWHPDVAMSGYEAQETLYDLLRLYDCAMGSVSDDEMDQYSSTFEVDRDDLIKMRNSIASQDDFFQQHESYIRKVLKISDTTPMQMVKALDVLINNSDKQSDWIYVSWF